MPWLLDFIGISGSRRSSQRNENRYSQHLPHVGKRLDRTCSYQLHSFGHDHEPGPGGFVDMGGSIRQTRETGRTGVQREPEGDERMELQKQRISLATDIDIGEGSRRDAVEDMISTSYQSSNLIRDVARL